MHEFLSPAQRTAFYNPCYLIAESLDAKFTRVERANVSVCLVVHCGHLCIGSGGKPLWMLSVAAPRKTKAKLRAIALQALRGVGDQDLDEIDEQKTKKLKLVDVIRPVTDAEAKALPAVADIRNGPKWMKITAEIALATGHKAEWIRSLG